MYDPPAPEEILVAVARFLKDEVATATSGRLSFQARVAANAVEMVGRQLALGAAAEGAEREGLERLLGMSGDLTDLNAELARRIAAGEMNLATPGLADHLWAVSLAKMAVDQPTYAAYRAALAERGDPQTKAP
jgi:hypothetical protein